MTSEPDIFTVERHDGVVHFRWRPGTFIDIELARMSVARIRDLTGTEQLPLCVHLNGTRGVSQEARNYYQANPAGPAMAFVATSPVARVIGNFFIGLNKPTIPTLLFDREEQAVQWLLSRR